MFYSLFFISDINIGLYLVSYMASSLFALATIGMIFYMQCYYKLDSPCLKRLFENSRVFMTLKTEDHTFFVKYNWARKVILCFLYGTKASIGRNGYIMAGLSVVVQLAYFHIVPVK